MKRECRWKIAGLFYFTAVFGLVPTIAFAYIDPSVTTYAIQAIAGVAVAAGAFFATYGRRFRKKMMNALGIEEGAGKEREPELEVYREDMKETLARRRSAARAAAGEPGKAKKPKSKGRLLTSVIAGLGFSMTVALRPMISLYLTNEGEFWFRLGDIIWGVLLLFAVIALIVGLIHFLLPGKRRVSQRLVFAAVFCGIAVCIYIQNHFMSGYLPILMGDPIDWSLYPGWGTASLILWIGVLAAMMILTAVSPRKMKIAVYGLFLLLLCAETAACGLDLLTADRDHERPTDRYFSQAGLYETTRQGNVTVLISDTYEATYLNEVLAEYPEYRDMLEDVTYYDNTSGISSVTYLSYAKLLTGTDFAMGESGVHGIRTAMENQTLIDEIHDNGWDIAYYTDCTPIESLKDKFLNYSDSEMKPTFVPSLELTWYLWESTLFRSMPQQLKDPFDVYIGTFNRVRGRVPVNGGPSPFTEDDETLYRTLRDSGLKAVDAEKPKYSIVQMYGLHNPVEINSELEHMSYGDNVSNHEQKMQAARAMIKFYRTYLDSLKAAGTYDRTTVIMIADHGFNMRYYPILLVKEAGSEPHALRVDSTPLSLQEDFEPLMVALTGGKSFSEAVADMHIPEDRVRYALDFRSTSGYGGPSDRRTKVTIRGDARDPENYSVEKDEFLADEQFSGKCEPGEPFISHSAVMNNTVAVYGYDDGALYGHTTVFDAFFRTAENRKLRLRMTAKNTTGKQQRVIFSMDGNEIGQAALEAGEEREITVDLPEKEGDRWTIELNTPDATLRNEVEKVLFWVSYDSIAISDAVIEERP